MPLKHLWKHKLLHSNSLKGFFSSLVLLPSPHVAFADLRLRWPQQPGKSCGVCGLSYHRCSMNIWCHAHHISGTLKRNLYSLQMLVFLWLSLITKKIEETELETGACPRSPSNTWQPLLCGGQPLWSFKHPSIRAVSSFFLCYSSSWLLVFHPLTGWRWCYSLTGSASVFEVHFGLEGENVTSQISVFFHTCLFIFLNQMTDLFKCATEHCASPSSKWNVNEKRHICKKIVGFLDSKRPGALSKMCCMLGSFVPHCSSYSGVALLL